MPSILRPGRFAEQGSSFGVVYVEEASLFNCKSRKVTNRGILGARSAPSVEVADVNRPD
jgi:hypothetical protein